jgi:tRNA threonylcarbamoyl adenosine modification protein (Sua5/YciO/YrdC/YwlC family)
MLLAVNPDHPEPRKIQRAIDALQSGEVIAYPTDTVYGLGCDLFNKRAVDRLYTIKGVDHSHPLAFICPDLGDIARYAQVDNATYRVLRRYLPGPYCFILEATREVPKLVQMKRKSVGIRVPGHAVVRTLARELGRPIISTTAQKAGGNVLCDGAYQTVPGGEPYVDPVEIDRDFRGLGLVLDGGGGGVVPTTVIDLTKRPPELVREGLGPVGDFVEG